MDAHKMGSFIAQRRKELGLTQVELANMLHITDKAISRWERGVGLPDINILEPLAQKLDVNLIELIQGQITTRETISIQEAEIIVSDTIQLSVKDEISRWIGIAILGIFGIITLALLGLLATDGSIVVYSVGSIVTGLIAWSVPIWQMTLVRTAKIIFPVVISLGAALTSLTIQFFQISHDVGTGDFAAIEDTIHVLCFVAVVFCIMTLFFNLLMVWTSRKK